jgi:hypothetical protein
MEARDAVEMFSSSTVLLGTVLCNSTVVNGARNQLNLEHGPPSREAVLRDRGRGAWGFGLALQQLQGLCWDGARLSRRAVVIKYRTNRLVRANSQASPPCNQQQSMIRSVIPI